MGGSIIMKINKLDKAHDKRMNSYIHPYIRFLYFLRI